MRLLLWPGINMALQRGGSCWMLLSSLEPGKAIAEMVARGTSRKCRLPKLKLWRDFSERVEQSARKLGFVGFVETVFPVQAIRPTLIFHPPLVMPGDGHQDVPEPRFILRAESIPTLPGKTGLDSAGTGRTPRGCRLRGPGWARAGRWVFRRLSSHFEDFL